MSTILAVAKNRLLNLRHDRAAISSRFVLPVAFFSIFAGIFAGGSSRAATRRIPVAVVDEDGTESSGRFVAALGRETGLDVKTARPAEKGQTGRRAFHAAAAEAAVRSRRPAGGPHRSEGLRRAARSRSARVGCAAPKVEVLADSADPVAPQVLGGLVQKVVMTAMPASMARSGMDEVDRWSGGLTPGAEGADGRRARASRQRRRLPASRRLRKRLGRARRGRNPRRRRRDEDESDRRVLRRRVRRHVPALLGRRRGGRAHRGSRERHTRPHPLDAVT